MNEEVAVWLSEASEQNLDPQAVALHRGRLKNVFNRNQSLTFKVIDTCRLANKGLVSYSFAKGVADNEDIALESVVAFVPAAGASSRYFSVLHNLLEALEGKDRANVLAWFARHSFRQWALGSVLQGLLEDASSTGYLSDEDLCQLRNLIAKPKALQYLQDGRTFLQKKSDEHHAIKGVVNKILFT